jgi:isoleucyl-tRNA synthetase
MSSVHLLEFPQNIIKQDEELITKMDTVREICSAVLNIRKKFNLRARLPLAKLTVIGANALTLEKFKKYIADEANVKKVVLDPNFARDTETKLEIRFDVAGKKFGSKMPEIVKAIKSGNWNKLANGSVLAGKEILSSEDFKMTLVPTSEGESFESIGNDFVVVLDTEVSEALEMEGMARDFVRIVQNERKQHSFEVNDRISLAHFGNEKFSKMINDNLTYIKEQCLIENCIQKNDDARFFDVAIDDAIGKILIERL